MVPQMVMIINELHERGRFPYIVYNSNGYDKVDTLKRLEGLVDVYLPDFKYSESELGKLYSDAKDYCNVAGLALKEMYRQMGASLITDRKEIASRGMIIRHLVLPGQVENSKKVLDFIADELSTRVTISLMSQYHPVTPVREHPELGRTVSSEEYEAVSSYMEELGFVNGWVQELESNLEYLPDFTLDHPFESNISSI
jgi:putative pyruvate formate lyase activating enzyme